MVLANTSVPEEKRRKTPLQNWTLFWFNEIADNVKYVNNAERGDDNAKRSSCRFIETRGYDSRRRTVVREKDAGA